MLLKDIHTTQEKNIYLQLLEEKNTNTYLN